jgi:exodeoxyribonuclease VII large subunit
LSKLWIQLLQIVSAKDRFDRAEIRSGSNQRFVSALTQHRVFEAERGRIRNHAQRVDELGRRAQTGLVRRVERARDRYRRIGERLDAFRWDRQIADRRSRVATQEGRLSGLVRQHVAARRSVLARLAGKLDSLSPLAVLSRGYALVFDGSGHLVREAQVVGS